VTQLIDWHGMVNVNVNVNMRFTWYTMCFITVYKKCFFCFTAHYTHSGQAGVANETQ